MYNKLIISTTFVLFIAINAFSQPMPSENRVYLLKKGIEYNDVIGVIGPSKEKIIKKTKNEAVWVYNSFELYFKNDKLQKVDLHDDRLTLDKSLKEAKKLASSSSLKARSKKKESEASNLLEGIGFAGGS